MQPKLGLVIALASEGRSLLGRGAWRRHNGVKVRVHQLQDDLMLIATSAGIGTEKAQMAANDLISSGVSALASVGLAGGLDPELKAGDIVIASDVLHIDADHTVGPWRAWGSAQAVKILRSEGFAVRSGTLLTTEQEMLTCDRKESLFKQHQALTVDMESAVVARIAHQVQIPFFGLRAVCDPADQTVPEELFRCLDANGHIHISSVLQNLTRRPALIKDMWYMNRYFSAARTALKRAWQSLIANRLPGLLVNGQG